LKELGDVKWRSLAKEREKIASTKPSLESADGVLALLVALHDKVGPKALGAAINKLDREDKRLRINNVRYYSMKALKDALLADLKDAKKRREIEALFP
jgi:hypothetical protein